MSSRTQTTGIAGLRVDSPAAEPRWLLIVGMLFGAGACGSSPEPAVPEGMLPASVTPTDYRLELTIVPDEERFTGRVEIEVRLSEPARQIWLHGEDLMVGVARVIGPDGSSVPATYEQVDPAGIARVVPDAEIPAGDARLVFEYEAAFGDGSALYTVDTGERRYVASLMFSSEARRVFPSFDEPRFKTPYEITIVAPANHAVTTNAPMVSSDAVPSDLKRVRFARSQPLPTYLVGLAVGPYDVVGGRPVASTELRQREIPVRAFGAEGKGEMLRYVADSSDKIVTTLETYFGAAYPYEKLDLIAVPDPTARGAMEDAAIITYGEFELLTDPDAPPAHYRNLVYLHAHELAHQWMGNLVTPRWWDDFWINESFATWTGLRVGRHVAPDRDLERIGLRWGLEAMATDTHADAQEIHPRIETIAGMRPGLNQLMYWKGAAVLAMFEHYVGEEPFREGVRTYIRRHLFGNATTADFVDAFEDGVLASGGGRRLPPGSLVAALSSFLDQPGVPRLDVDWSCVDDAIEVRVAQARYVPLGYHANPDREWRVPFCIAYDEDGSRSTHCALLEEAETTISAPAMACPSTIMPNADGAGYYRFSMSPERLKALAAQASDMSASEALSLEDSLAAAMHAGDLDVVDYLRAVPLFARHSEWDVATAPLPRLAFILDHLVRDDNLQNARAYARELYAPLLNDIGLVGTSDADRSRPDEAEQLRERLVPFLAGRVHDAKLRERLLAIDASQSALQPAVVESAMAAQLERGGLQAAEALWQRWQGTDDEQLRQTMLGAFAAQTEPALAARARKLALEEDISPHAAVALLTRQAQHERNLPALWAWQKEHLAALGERIRYYWQRDLVSLTGNFCSVAKRDDVSRTFEANQVLMESGIAVLESALESIDHCVAMKERHTDAVNRFFAEQPESGGIGEP